VVAHDGFTLADLVAYTRKVNAANGEDNRDGTDANFSWNNGAEGPSDDPAILAGRARDQRALLATLLLARGTPMLAMGSELGHSQGGNNNAYAQDNPTAWLDWAAADEGLIAWTRRLLRLRRDHPALRDDRLLTGQANDVSLIPDVEWRDAAGDLMTQEAWQAPHGRTLMMTLAGASQTEDTTERISVIMHRGFEDTRVLLPPVRAGHIWYLLADNSAPDDEGSACQPIAGLSITVTARGVMVVVEQPRDRGRSVTADTGLLDRLAHAAGIAPDWWDVSGRHTIVSADTQRALLAAMHLPAATQGEARDTMRQLSDSLDRRALPHALVSRSDEAAILTLGVEPGLGRRPVWLTIEREGGETRQLRVGTEDGTVTACAGADGLPAVAWRIALPMLPEGRHRIWRDDAAEAVCHLTIAPRRCFLPDFVRRGRRHFGISAQLYALRRAGDQGIGDFTTLAMLTELAGREGATAIGINPLHMLFPNERERASPYHPSDRRFLDPIYLDVATDSPAPVPATVRDGDLVAWSEVWAFKRDILERQFAAFANRGKSNVSETECFYRFVEGGGLELRRFATFQAIAETRPGVSWRQWPTDLRKPDHPAVAAFERAHSERVRFHQYLQFLADRQLSAAVASGSGLEVGLYRDLAVGAAPDGAEAWARPDDLADGAWIGAPPDLLASEGQNWHLPPPLPLRMAENGYAPVAALIASNMRHAGALRIDHAMGLSRLFWIPDGGLGADGAYVAYPFADLLGQVALESARARCMVIGEDLGTVADGFRATMADADILSYRVLLLEREGREFRRAGSYPARAVACVTTHDLPPLAGWWEGADMLERSRLGLLPLGSAAEAEREEERAALVTLLADEGCLARPEIGAVPVTALVTAAHDFVASTPADLMLVQTEDLAGARVGVNLPGTDSERPNWRLKVTVPVEALLTGATAQTIIAALRKRR
jgi:4-alpha-glucanotransferase